VTNVLILLAVTEQVRKIYRDRLARAFPELTINTVGHRSDALPYLADMHVLMTFGPLIDDDLLSRSPNLRWIQGLGSGVDGLTDRPTLAEGVLVTRVHGIVAPVSEAAMGALLALSRDMLRSFRSQQERRWDRYPATLLKGKTVGILGVGAIAEELAPKCKAFGMRVVGISSAPRPIAAFDEIVSVATLKEAVATLDYLVVLTPYSKATHRIINEPILGAMKPSSYLINLARGGVLDEDALIAALKERRLAGAALDVFQQSPLAPEHPFWSLDNLIVTPHIGGLCDVYPDLALPTVEHNMRCFLSGEAGRMIDLVKG
jgi:D-2-hydroxyacid dehydrogenase (NADP+)